MFLQSGVCLENPQWKAQETVHNSTDIQNAGSQCIDRADKQIMNALTSILLGSTIFGIVAVISMRAVLHGMPSSLQQARVRRSARHSRDRVRPRY